MLKAVVGIGKLVFLIDRGIWVDRDIGVLKDLLGLVTEGAAGKQAAQVFLLGWPSGFFSGDPFQFFRGEPIL